MGCCSSSPVDQDFLTTSEDNYDTATIPLPVSYYNKSRPFKRSSLMWTSETPMTVTDLEQKRLTYWESAPTYGVSDNSLFFYNRCFIDFFYM